MFRTTREFMPSERTCVRLTTIKVTDITRTSVTVTYTEARKHIDAMLHYASGC